MDAEEEWMLDEDVSDTLRAKIFSLKVCRNRCLAHASSDKALEISTPVLKMLSALLEYNGSLSADADEEYAAPELMSLCEVLTCIVAQRSSHVCGSRPPYPCSTCRLLRPMPLQSLPDSRSWQLRYKCVRSM